MTKANQSWGGERGEKGGKRGEEDNGGEKLPWGRRSAECGRGDTFHTSHCWNFPEESEPEELVGRVQCEREATGMRRHRNTL